MQGAFLVQKFNIDILRALFVRNSQICPFYMQKQEGSEWNGNQREIRKTG